MNTPRNTTGVGEFPVLFREKDVEQSIAARFAEQVGLHSMRLAVKDRDYELTYGQLDDRANGLARRLTSYVSPRNGIVGLLMDESAAVVAAMLAVLKCGGTFLPLDPRFPLERLQLMVRESGCGVIVADTAHADAAAELGTPVVRSEEAPRGVGFAPRGIAPTHPSYVLYTSGSTGDPKGIVQNQRIVLHNVMKYTNSFRITPDDRLTMLFSVGFGEAMNDLFCALLNGASVHIYPVHKYGIDGLATWLNERRISIFHSVPSLFRVFVHQLDGAEGFPFLRIVNLGGEAVYWEDVALCGRYVGRHCILANSYGATETKLICQNLVSCSEPERTGVLPVGFESSGVTLIISDETGRERDEGAIGEIVVRSRNMSVGYLSRPELETERFQVDPSDEKSRLYRTGDLGRRLPGRLFEHLGRKDRQVKIRGYRVELGEIEARLMSRAGVAQCVVVDFQKDGEQSLVAYVVPNGNEQLDVQRVRGDLASGMPHYMVPSVIMILDSLPLTSTGKIDRQCLPTPEHFRREPPTTRVGPRNSVEIELAAIWRDVLGIEEVGIHDDFFLFGGDSLAATRVVARVSSLFHVDLPLRAMFEAPTVAELAAEVVLFRNEVSTAESEAIDTNSRV